MNACLPNILYIGGNLKYSFRRNIDLGNLLLVVYGKNLGLHTTTLNPLIAKTSDKLLSSKGGYMIEKHPIISKAKPDVRL